MRGDAIPTIAQRHKISEFAVGNLLRTAQGRLNHLLRATNGTLKPEVRVENGEIKATRGRPDLALGAEPAVVAVDQNRPGPEEVTHEEMNELAVRLFDEHPEAGRKLITRWMDSGGTVITAEGFRRSLKAILDEAE